jgi:Skp family chaperone for outer membrane proteins
MRAVAIAAALALVLGAAPVFAQAAPTGQTPASQAAPRPAQPPAAQPAPAPPPPAPFPQGARVGFVNLQAIAQLSADGKAANAKVQALAQKKQTEGQTKAKALQDNQQKLQTSGSVMSEAARGQLEKEIDRQTREGQRFEQDAQAELNELQQELQAEFQKKLIPVLEQLSKEKGLQVLLSAADSGVIWADPGLDLTLEAVKKLDSAAGPRPTAATPPAAPAGGAPAGGAPAGGAPAAPKPAAPPANPGQQ